MNGAAAAAQSSSSTLLPLPPAREIPSTFAASFRSWWAAGEKESASSEERLLRRLPFFRSGSTPSLNQADGPVVAHSERVTLDNPKHYLNTLAIRATAPASDAPPPAILLHGYGAGLGFFFLNFPTLAQWAGTRGSAVYALDWLGMGRSARPPFRVKAKREDIPGRVHEAEAFFVDSLEQWRARMGLEKMTLIGHSLGAYFSVAYALRYPTRVSKLVLLSPAGVPRDPDTTMPSREVTDGQVTGDGGPEPTGNVDAIRKEQAAEKRKETRASRLFTYLWEEGWSPFQVVRSAVFWGPMLVGKYSSRRFGALSEDETRDMHDYITNITLAKGSGEYCISHILAPGAHARMPLVDRIAALKIPVTFVYGEHDWMDPEGGVTSIDNLRAAGNNDGRMYVIPHAGHHVYLDNAKAVNKLLLKELDSRRR
ncbi:alpha/beta-hydrolase [Artomyces pyxidatus]|uniref:Alpha/beta-hydrolase n=1 Tax=Artomyces pyxidatus TaxID=48021 RepID=A0ACB8TKK5_9AGAM|nr:alpha/beta-hydrolase [Artomyces pyxidatus]